MFGCWSAGKIHGAAAAWGRVHLPLQQPTPPGVSAAGGRRPGRKPNKKRAEKQQVRRENRHSTTAARLRQQPQGKGPAQDPQQQPQQATASSSSMPQCAGAVADSALQQRSATSSTAMVAAGTPATLETVQQQQQHRLQQQQVSERETRANKKRRLLLSSGNETPKSNRSPVTPATPGGIPQVDGRDSGPSTPELEPKFRDPPTPPPMSQFLPADPNRVICHLCFKNVHFLMYDQCEACHYRLKYAYKLL